jgi:membrane complex biogenesis BtpA family protein
MNEKSYFQRLHCEKDIIGMVHVQALPGTPRNHLAPNEIIEKALREAGLYKQFGLETVMIENMHDRPYTKVIRPEITAMMTVIGYEIKKLGLNCGIQILAGGNKEALAVAKAAGLDFIRAEGYVFGHIGDEGYFDSCAGELLRYRKEIGAENVAVFTDIKKKHSSHAITADVTLEETAKAAQFFISDGVIITGRATGEEPTVEDMIAVQPVGILKLIGSGITAENIEKYWNYADALIVGSYFKYGGIWAREIDPHRVITLMGKVSKLRQ